MNTVAIHFIWTTYLTWPPGDPRGHWSPLFDFYGNLIERGHQLNLPDSTTYGRSVAIAEDKPILLTALEMQTVADVIGTLVAPPDATLIEGQNDKRPKAHAFAIENDHVHLLTGAIPENLTTFIRRVKGMSSSAVLHLPACGERSRVWTAGYWKVFLFDAPGVHAAAKYVEDHNRRRGLPARVVDWISPIED